MGSYDKQIAIFSHIKNFVRDRRHRPGPTSSRPTPTSSTPRKYHWAWGIPVDHEVTSVGIVVPAAYFRDKKESKHDFYVRELRELNPGLARRTTTPSWSRTFTSSPTTRSRWPASPGPGYICVGDSHRFVDPIFSFGLYVAIQESKAAVEAAVRLPRGRRRTAMARQRCRTRSSTT